MGDADGAAMVVLPHRSAGCDLGRLPMGKRSHQLSAGTIAHSIGRVADRHWFIAPAAIIVALMLSPPLISLLDRSPPIVFTGGEVIPPVVQPGGKIQLVRDAYVTKPCGGLTYRQIIDAKGYVHLLTVTPTMSDRVMSQNGLQHLVGRAFDLPDAITAGPATMRARIDYVCPWLWLERNPLQRVFPIKVALPDLTFTVMR